MRSTSTNPAQSIMKSMAREKFSCISQIIPEDDNTWRDKIFLTFDIDWAHDVVLQDCIEMVEKADVCATWFITHDTPLLSRLRENPKFELGIHPNFNFLFNLQTQAGYNPGEVVERLLSLVPEAKAVRSHHMTQSSSLLKTFRDFGLTHDCNHFVPYQAQIELKPWRLWNDLVRVPYFWEDDLERIYELKTDCLPIEAVLKRSGLRCFDFHPIHVYLNTENLDRYESTRSSHRDPEVLINKRFDGKGTRNELETVLKTATQ